MCSPRYKTLVFPLYDLKQDLHPLTITILEINIRNYFLSCLEGTSTWLKTYQQFNKFFKDSS